MPVFGRKGAGSMAYANGLCALVLDEEPMIHQAVSALLSNDGYQVKQAENGRQALALFAEGGVLRVVLV